jgi:hypothetical protein
MAFRNWTIIGYFLISCAALFAGAQEEIFLKANEAYKKHDFAQAEQLYASIAKKGLAVWYNMGLTAKALDKPADALAYYHKALQQTGPAEFWRIKNQMQTIHPEGSFAALVRNYAQYASSFLSLLHWQLLLIICLALCLLCMKKAPTYALLWILAVSISTITTVRYRLITDKKFFVKAMTANVYAGPGKNFSIIGTVPLYGQGTVLQEKDSWYRVRYTRLKGWLEANDIVIA